MKNRTHVAEFAADQLQGKDMTRSELVLMMAAWLKDSKSTRQASYLVQDIAKKLASNGYVYVTVTSAHKLTDATRQAIHTYLHNMYQPSSHIEISEVIDPSVIGGVRIDTPTGSLDATVKRKLIQIVKGVQK